MADDIQPDGRPAALGALLAGPITALQEAQIEAEKQVVAFILEHGLVAGGDGSAEAPLELASLRFQMDRAIADPDNPGAVVMRKAEVTVPLLSLMRVPALRIGEATIDLAVELEDAGETTTETSAAAPSAAGGAAAPAGGAAVRPAAVARLSPATLARLDKAALRPQVKPVIAKISSRSTRSFRNRGKLNIRLTLRSADDDAFYDRLTRLIGDSMSALVDTGDGNFAPPPADPPPDPEG